MFLHLGNEVTVKMSDIVAIVNNDKFKSRLVAGIDQSAVPEGSTPKSVIITPHKIYYSSISVQTLTERSKFCWGQSPHGFVFQNRRNKWQKT